MRRCTTTVKRERARFASFIHDVSILAALGIRHDVFFSERSLASGREIPIEERDPPEKLLEILAESAHPAAGGDRQHFVAGLQGGLVWGATVFGYCAATRMGFLASLAPGASRFIGRELMS